MVSKNNKQKTSNPGKYSSKVRDYSNDPTVIKRTKEANRIIKEYGITKELLEKIIQDSK